MKKVFFKVIHVIFIFSIFLPASLYAEIFNVYPGQENTLYNVASTAKAGDTVIFHDGTYIERKQVRITSGGGSEGNPILFKSANPHGAKIVFDMGRSWGRVYVTVPYIYIEDFEFTEKTRPTANNPTWNHILTFYPGADHCKVSGNKIHGGYEEGVKTHLVNNISIENNYIYDFTHEGIDCTPAHNSVIRNNHLYNNGRCHIMLKYKNATNTIIYGNYIHNDTVQMSSGGYGITLGGSSSDGGNIQATNCIAFNNIIVSESPGLILKGIGIRSAIDSGVYNNVIIGTKYGIFTDTPSPQDNVNPTFKNNILYNIQVAASSFDKNDTGRVTDYNLYYKAPNPPSETHGKYNIDPQFIDPKKNWRLSENSPAINSGVNWSFQTRTGKSVNIAFDFVNKDRTGTWDIGAYEFVLLSSPHNLRVIDSGF